MINKWNEIYPRPQLVRKEWTGLNGEWKFMVTDSGDDQPADADWETINVPFCPESRLSGIGRRITPGQTMIYERDLDIQQAPEGRRILLHFGAVDQKAEVFIDGRCAG